MNENLIVLFIKALTGNNLILYSLLGICPLVLYQLNIKECFSIGLIITAIMLIGTWLTLFFFNFILLQMNLIYLKILCFVFFIYLIIQFIKIIANRFSPSLSKLFDTYPEFFYTNYAIYGLAFLNINLIFEFLNATVLALGSGLGYLIVILIFNAIKERINDIKKLSPSRRLFMELVVLGLMSLVFICITGLR